MRIMGLDYGSKTVGVAVSDALGLTAQGIEIVRRKSENKLRQTLARIEEIAKEYGVEKIVLGFPKHMKNEIVFFPTTSESGPKNLSSSKKCWRDGQVCPLLCGTSG